VDIKREKLWCIEWTPHVNQQNLTTWTNNVQRLLKRYALNLPTQFRWQLKCCVHRTFRPKVTRVKRLSSQKTMLTIQRTVNVFLSQSHLLAEKFKPGVWVRCITINREDAASDINVYNLVVLYAMERGCLHPSKRKKEGREQGKRDEVRLQQTQGLQLTSSSHVCTPARNLLADVLPTTRLGQVRTRHRWTGSARHVQLHETWKSFPVWRGIYVYK
jgi:hypothetical protein